MPHETPLARVILLTLDEITRALEAKPSILDGDVESRAFAAIGPVSESMVRCIAEDEAAFRKLAWRLRTAGQTFRKRKTEPNRAAYVRAVKSASKWIANVRNIGSRYPKRSITRTR